MTIDTLKSLLEIGWPGIVTVAFAFLAINYIADQRKQIDTLWAHVNALEAEIMKVKQQFIDDHLKASQ